MTTTPEAFAQYQANLSSPGRKKPTRSLDHVPSPQEILALQLREAGISYTPEYCFHPDREYRADFLIIGERLLVEVDGNGRNGHPGSHRSVKGYEYDRERDAAALLLNYTVLRVTPRHVLNMQAVHWIQRLIATKETPP